MPWKRGFSMCCKKVSGCLFSCCRHDVIYCTVHRVGLGKTREWHAHTHMQARMHKTTNAVRFSSSSLCVISTKARTHKHTLHNRPTYGTTSPFTFFGSASAVIRNLQYFTPRVTRLRVSSLLWFIWTQRSKWLMNMGSTLLRRHVCVSTVCVCVWAWMKYHIVIFQNYPCTQCFFFLLPQRSTGRWRHCRWREERKERE